MFKDKENLKVKKEKVKVDFKNDQFTTVFQKRRYADSTFSGLLIQIKFIPGYNGYTVTYEAKKALQNKDHSR